MKQIIQRIGQAINRATLMASAATIVGFSAGASDALAQGTTFDTLGRNVVGSVDEMPGALTAICYIMGLMLGVFGILKIKDHVENPGKEPLKDGAIRLVAGGALLALPLIYNAMQNTIGTGGTAVNPAALNRATFNVGS